MSSAVFILVVNVSLAALFAATFMALSLSKGAPSSARWFAVTYLVGMMTPLSELGVRFSGWPSLFSFTSFATFVTAFLLTAVALARHFDRPAPWIAAATILVVSLVVRIVIWGGARNTMPYELIYQMPFAVSTLLCWWVVRQSGEPTRIRQIISYACLIVALHFIFKAEAAVLIGSGATAHAYATSSYAVLSQSVTAVLLVAVGLLLQYSVFRRMLDGARSASQIDDLSGLLNRRGFEFFAQAIIDRTTSVSTIALVLFDLDHFKRINDSHGHAVGDDVIRHFATVLRDRGPPQSICARIGGEEFAVIIENCNEAMASLFAESVRVQLDTSRADPVEIRTSAGLTASTGPAPVDILLGQADIALYRAKRSGRNCVRGFSEDAESQRRLVEAG